MEIQPRTAPRPARPTRKTVHAEKWRPNVILQAAPVKVNHGNDCNTKNTMEGLV